MATAIAKSTTVCQVCGSKIVAGASSITYAPNIKGSGRHAKCYGQIDRYDSKGNPLGEKPAPSGNAKTVEFTEEETMYIFGETEDAPTLKQPAPPVNSPPTNLDPMAQMMATSLAPYLEGLLKGKVDENTVRRLIKEVATQKSQEELKLQEEAIAKAVKAAIEERGLVTIAVKQLNGSVTKLEGLQHKETPFLLRLMQLRKNIYLHGPTGSGKSTAARKCAAAIKTEAHPDGLPFYYISLNPQSSPTRIEGYKAPSGEDIITLFIAAYEFGGVFCADELDNSMANLWTSVNNAIDSDLGSFPKGMVKRHPDFIFVGTGNTNLSGCSVYKDRKALDKATIARFVFWEWNYDIGLEKAITLGKNAKAMPWLQWVHKLRAFAKINNPALYAYTHPRACYDGAEMLADGFTVAQCADAVVFKQTFDATAKLAALQNCPLPTEEMAA